MRTSMRFKVDLDEKQLNILVDALEIAYRTEESKRQSYRIHPEGNPNKTTVSNPKAECAAWERARLYCLMLDVLQGIRADRLIHD
jgi:hypothetical protein